MNRIQGQEKKVDIVMVLRGRSIDFRFFYNGGFVIDCLKIVEEGKIRNGKLFGGVIKVDGVRKFM